MKYTYKYINLPICYSIILEYNKIDILTNSNYLCNFKKNTISIYMSQLSEQELVRRDKLTKLRELGINPYPAELFPYTHTSKQVKQDFSDGIKIVVVGRIMSRRINGKYSFDELLDCEYS